MRASLARELHDLAAEWVSAIKVEASSSKKCSNILQNMLCASFLQKMHMLKKQNMLVMSVMKRGFGSVGASLRRDLIRGQQKMGVAGHLVLAKRSSSFVSACAMVKTIYPFRLSESNSHQVLGAS